MVLKSGHGFDGTRRGKRRVLETLGVANVKGRVHNNSSALYTDRMAVCVVALPNQKRLAHIGEPSRSRCLKMDSMLASQGSQSRETRQAGSVGGRQITVGAAACFFQRFAGPRRLGKLDRIKAASENNPTPKMPYSL